MLVALTEEATFPVVYIIGTYPLLTTTFIDRELAALHASGVDVQVVSIRRPNGPLSEIQRDSIDDVTYVLPAKFFAVLSANLRYLTCSPTSYFGVLWILLKGRHPSMRLRLRTLLHFGMAVHIAGVIEVMSPPRLHAHFLDRATTVAMVVSRLLDVPYSATAHANDIYVDPVLLSEKIGAADFVATCTGYNADHLASFGDPAKIHLIHHGLDLHAYRERSEVPLGTPAILAVGQLKEKKGFRYLVEACWSLKLAGVEFTCEIVGEGPLRPQLERQIADSGLVGTVRLLGAVDHETVIERIRAATVFTLPSVVTSDGDRDGIPNVILEAMAVGLPVVSTRVSGIPEVVVDDVTGVLVDPEDADELAEALERLLSDVELRSRMGERGRKLVEQGFAVERNVAKLRDLFISPDDETGAREAPRRGRLSYHEPAASDNS